MRISVFSFPVSHFHAGRQLLDLQYPAFTIFSKTNDFLIQM